MKKIFGVLVLLLVIVLGWSVFFLPSSVTLVASVSMKAPAARTYKFLANQNEWSKWWPVLNTGHATSFAYNGNNYSIGRKSIYIIETITQQKDSTLEGRILVASITIDSTVLEWNIQVNCGYNPFKRIRHYFTTDKLKGDMASILNSLKKFVEKQDNIYGMSIERAKVTDTVLVSTRGSFSHYPSTQEIYGLIEKLKTYIKSENATETNFPMLNIQQADSNRYYIMVAIPTSRLLNGKGDIELKRMVMGNVIWGEVKGGPAAIAAAIEQLENYKQDQRLTSPAIPFASLITNRTIETDTSKWVTRVYYPVF